MSMQFEIVQTRLHSFKLVFSFAISNLCSSISKLHSFANCVGTYILCTCSLSTEDRTEQYFDALKHSKIDYAYSEEWLSLTDQIMGIEEAMLL